MKSMAATAVKQNFGAALRAAASGPVAIQKHGKTIAWLSPPGLSAPPVLTERQRAREQQAHLELQRLVKHQRIAMALLSHPDEAPAKIEAARAVVDRWAREGQCSADYVLAWRRLLALPAADLAMKMCGDLNGWGTALRQNSPWHLV